MPNFTLETVPGNKAFIQKPVGRSQRAGNAFPRGSTLPRSGPHLRHPRSNISFPENEEKATQLPQLAKLNGGPLREGFHQNQSRESRRYPRWAFLGM